MKRKNHLLLSVLLSLVMLFSLIVPASMATTLPDCSGPKVGPDLYKGNPADMGYKVDPPINGVERTFTVTLENIDYTVHHKVSNDGKFLMFWVEGDYDIVTKVIVKGGDDAYIYNYSPAVFNDCNLRSPDNKGGNIPDISHYDFAFASPTPKGALEVTKNVILDNVLNSDVINKTFSITIEGPSYPTGNTQTIGIDGGKLLWENLIPGNYTVTEDPPGAEWDVVISAENVEITAGQTATTTVTNTYQEPGTVTGSISGYKFHDQNNNGAHDNDEPRLADWKINLYILDETPNGNNSGDYAPCASTFTGENGAFRFDNLAPGTYRLVEEITTEQISDGWGQTTPNDPDYHEVVINENDESLEYGPFAFGNYRETQGNGSEKASLKIRKFNDVNKNGVWDTDEDEINGWTVYLEEFLGNDGWSSLDSPLSTPVDLELDPGTYKVTEETRTNWTATTSITVEVTLAANENKEVVFGNYQEKPVTVTGSISGYKFHDQNNNGERDEGEPRLPNWEINLYNLTEIPNGNSSGDYVPCASITTDENGVFRFDNLEFGTYKVDETITDGWIQTLPATSCYDNLVIGETLTYSDLAFGNYRETPGNGGGGDDDDDSGSASLNVFKFNDANKNGIWDAGEEEIKGWKIFVNGKEYSTPVRITVDPANYTVEEEADKDWEACTDTSFSFTLNDGDTKTIHFGNCPVDVEKEYPPDDPSTPPEDPEEEPEVEKDIPPDKPSTPPEEPKDEPEEERIIPPEPPAQTSPPRPELPRTGSNSLLITGLGVLLSAAGIFLKRRKR